MTLGEIEEIARRVAREEAWAVAREAAMEVGNALPMRTQVDAFWGRDGGDGGGVTPFPQRLWDPFYWRWDPDAETLTIGNIRLYSTDGDHIELADQTAISLTDESDTWVYMTFDHGTKALAVATSADEADSLTDDEDRTAGLQRYPLYCFTRSGASVTCKYDRIHHGAVSAIYR